jgi:hypothetical protein
VACGVWRCCSCTAEALLFMPSVITYESGCHLPGFAFCCALYTVRVGSWQSQGIAAETTSAYPAWFPSSCEDIDRHRPARTARGAFFFFQWLLRAAHGIPGQQLSTSLYAKLPPPTPKPQVPPQRAAGMGIGWVGGWGGGGGSHGRLGGGHLGPPRRVARVLE